MRLSLWLCEHAGSAERGEAGCEVAGWKQMCSILGYSLQEKGQLGFYKASLELKISPKASEIEKALDCSSTAISRWRLSNHLGGSSGVEEEVAVSPAQPRSSAAAIPSQCKPQPSAKVQNLFPPPHPPLPATQLKSSQLLNTLTRNAAV